MSPPFPVVLDTNGAGDKGYKGAESGREMVILMVGGALAKGESWCEAHTHVRLAGRS